jgi:hypothetical protein
MSLAEWLRAFRAMHEKAVRGQLDAGEQVTYRAGQDELARALLAAQRLTLKPGETPRQTLRVARALQVDISLLTSNVRAITVEFSVGGFSCLIAKSPPVGDEVGFSLRLPSAQPIAGKARVVDLKPLQGNVRVAFQFVGLDSKDRDRLELFVFDTVLSQLAS